MKEYQYQNIYFMETFYQCPSLSYNQILINFVEKCNIENIKFSNKYFNACKSIYQKKIYNNETIENKLDNIKFQGKNYLIIIRICRFT
jgi:hypothetical protein